MGIIDMAAIYDFVESIHMILPVIAVLLFVFVVFFYGIRASPNPPDEYLERMRQLDERSRTQQPPSVTPQKKPKAARKKELASSSEADSPLHKARSAELRQRRFNEASRRSRDDDEVEDVGVGAAGDDGDWQQVPTKKQQKASKLSKRQKSDDVVPEGNAVTEDASSREPAAATLTKSEAVATTAKVEEVETPTSASSPGKKKKKKKKNKSSDEFEVDESDFVPVTTKKRGDTVAVKQDRDEKNKSSTDGEVESLPVAKEDLSRQKSLDEKSSTSTGRSSSAQPSQTGGGGSSQTGTSSTNSSDLTDFEVVEAPISGSSSYDDIAAGLSVVGGVQGVAGPGVTGDLPGISEESAPSSPQSSPSKKPDPPQVLEQLSEEDDSPGGDVAGEKKKKSKKKKNKKQKAQYDPTELQEASSQGNADANEDDDVDLVGEPIKPEEAEFTAVKKKRRLRRE